MTSFGRMNPRQVNEKISKRSCDKGGELIKNIFQQSVMKSETNTFYSKQLQDMPFITMDANGRFNSN